MTKEAIKVALIVAAAGTSSRFEAGEKKEFLPLSSNLFPSQKGGTVLSCSIEAFLQFFTEHKSYTLSNLIITIPNADYKTKTQQALNASPYVRDTLISLCTEPAFVEGSTTRQASVLCALQYLRSLNENIDIVLIHDGARPFVTKEIVDDVIRVAHSKGASVPTIPPVDTQKEVDLNGKIIRHLTRSSLRAVQTPQGFCFEKLYSAHLQAENDNKEYTDDTQIWAEYVGDVYTVQGSEKNKKITFKQDLEYTMTEKILYRTGLGSDLHRLEKGLKLMIGGIEIPFDKGEVAHSDGDVLLHAITDSLLGAIGLGDIGELFPPNDDTWKNANSAVLLKSAWEKVQTEGWQLQNMDCILQMEKPKFLPWRENVIESISSILECEKERVFVKAKTGEGLGDIGQGRAISAQVVCLLKK